MRHSSISKVALAASSSTLSACGGVLDTDATH